MIPTSGCVGDRFSFWLLPYRRKSATDGFQQRRCNCDVEASGQFGNGDNCPDLENAVASFTFTLDSDSVCPRVVEVATVTPMLKT